MPPTALYRPLPFPTTSYRALKTLTSTTCESSDSSTPRRSTLAASGTEPGGRVEGATTASGLSLAPTSTFGTVLTGEQGNTLTGTLPGGGASVMPVDRRTAVEIVAGALHAYGRHLDRAYTDSRHGFASYFF